MAGDTQVTPAEESVEGRSTRVGRGRARLAGVIGRVIPTGEGESVKARSYLGAWRVLRMLPASQVYLAGAFAADATVRRRGIGVRRLQSNLTAVGVAPAALPAMTKAAMRSYTRYWCEVFRLPEWSPAQIRASVRVVGDVPVREQLAAGRGVVFALAHQGNWDLAGAWACLDLAPVTTVAEKLEPPEVFDAFVKFRRELGMTVHALGEPGLIGTLTTALKRGDIVPLLADRDLSGSGVEVTLAGQRAHVAAGPAMLADLSGAALIPVSITYEQVPVDADGWPESGYRTVITFLPEIELPAGGTRHERVRAGVEGYAAALGAAIAATPADWHMLQPVFADVEYDDRRRPAVRHAIN